MDTDPARPPVAPSADGTAPSITAILVNHNAGSRLGGLFDVLLREVESAVVVDNASTDGSLAAVEGRSDVTILRNSENRGFAAAVNQGADRAMGSWLLLVNPDIHLRPGDVTTLLRDVPSDVAAIAPLQVDADGRPRPETAGYEPSLLRYFVWAVVPSRFHGRFGPWLGAPFPAQDRDVDWVSGALVGLRREVFERLGRFDERFFLYHEDVDFGRRARAAGYRVMIRPAVRLHHEVAHGDVTRRIWGTLRSIDSLAQDFPGWRRRVLGAILAVGFGLRALLGSGATRDRGRAALPACWSLVVGRLRAAGPASD
jgi:N-acetylglucosaminyl-diphospho-decaprenol L-rhamnosyltransferase